MRQFAWRGVITLTLVLALLALYAHLVYGQNKEEQNQQQPGVIKVDTAYITLPVIVTNRYGQFVTGLDRSDFAITEDGTRQEISSFSSTEAPFNVALLIDTSHSTQQKLNAIRKAALAFIKQLQPDDRVLIVAFDDEVRFISELTNDHARLKRAVGLVKSGYATSLYDALTLTITQKLAPLTGRKAVVVLTDGVDTASKVATYESALELVSSAGIISYAIQYETRNEGGPVKGPISLPNWNGSLHPIFPDRSFVGASFSPANSFFVHSLSSILSLSSQSSTLSRGAQELKRDRYLVATDFLRALALQSGARYIRAETIESTSYAFALIAEELRHQYTLAYYSTNEKQDGGFRTIMVQINRDDLLVRTRKGYRAPLGNDHDGDKFGRKSDAAKP